MMDDTLLRKRGRKVYGTGWKRDPLGPHFCDNFIWAQRFLQMSAALPDSDCPGRARAIPIDLVHAPSPLKPRKNAGDAAWKEYRLQQREQRVTKVAAASLSRLRREVPKRTIICSVDGGFTNQTFFRNIPGNTVLIGRIRKNASLFAPPEESEQARKTAVLWRDVTNAG